MGVVYKLTSPENKEYIGQTTKSFAVRMYNHKSASRNANKKDGCVALNNALRKHGWDSFRSEIVVECDDTELDYYEEYYIKEYNTLAPNGYNLMTGGNTNKKYSDVTKEKIRQSALRRDSSVYRKDARTLLWPKYMVIFGGYPRISKHPNCSSKSFNDKKKTFDENVEDALQFLKLLNNGEVKVEIVKSDLPKGLQHCKNGYRVHVKLQNGLTTTKMFTNQQVPIEQRLEQAKNYLTTIISTQFRD